MLYPQVVPITGFSMGVNYGANKIRFPSPVPVGSRLRLGVKLLEVDRHPGRLQTTMEFTFEVEGASEAELRRRGHLSNVRVTAQRNRGITCDARSSIVWVSG